VIVVDTNVLSEPLRLVPHPRVVQWLVTNASEIAVTAITVAELRFGVHRLPAGRQRDALSVAIDDLLDTAGDRVLPFDARAAEVAGRLRADREATGRSVSSEDTMIAGICLAGGHSLATRNVRDFTDTTISLVNPWAA
jgi:predicted nucleic acid-binding protein